VGEWESGGVGGKDSGRLRDLTITEGGKVRLVDSMVVCLPWRQCFKGRISTL
jgi:hypothetical protein